MCFFTAYLYQCGRTEGEFCDRCQLAVDSDGSDCQGLAEQMVVMDGECVGCRIAADCTGTEEEEIWEREICKQEVEQAWDV